MLATFYSVLRLAQADGSHSVRRILVNRRPTSRAGIAEIKTFTTDEVRELWNVDLVTPTEAIMVRCALMLGLRRMEIVGMQRCQLEARTISGTSLVVYKVDFQANKAGELIPPKAGHCRVVPVPAPLADELFEWCADRHIVGGGLLFELAAMSEVGAEKGATGGGKSTNSTGMVDVL